MRPDDYDPIARRRQKRAAQQRRVLLIGGGIAAILLLLGCVGFVGLLVARKGRMPAALNGPAVGREGKDWTHRELFDHLKHRGVVADMAPHGNNTAIFMTAATTIDQAELMLEHGYLPEHAVVVEKCESANSAQDQAGLDNKGNRLAWGRFLFIGDKNLIAAIRNGLK